MKQDEAAEIALWALGLIASDEGALTRLMSETGVGAESLKRAPEEPELLGAVLDFLFADEILLLDFCRKQGVTPNQVIRARAALPGGVPDWA